MRRRCALAFLALPLLVCACAGDSSAPGALDAAAVAPAAEAQPWIDLMTCNEPEFFVAAPEVQLERLQRWPSLECRIEQQGGPYVECVVQGTMRLFDLPAHEITVWPAEGEAGMEVLLEGDPAEIARRAGAALGVSFRADDRPGSYAHQGIGPTGRSYRIAPARPGMTAFGCGFSGPAEDAALPPVVVPAGAALITGALSYPSESLPAMRVCTLDIGDPGRGYCVETAIDTPDYALAVPPGGWWLLAWPRGTGADGAPGRHSEATECLRRSEPGCDDHHLRAVHVSADEHRGGIDILDWHYDAAEPGPMEPRGEVPLR